MMAIDINTSPVTLEGYSEVTCSEAQESGPGMSPGSVSSAGGFS